MNANVCIDPTEMAEGDLSAYLTGDAPPQVEAHVARCPFCAAEVERLRQVDVRLLAAFYRSACPVSDILAAYVLDRLPAAERLRVAAHVRRCPTCQRETASVAGLTGDVPAALLERLRESLALALLTRPAAPVAAAVRGRGWQGRFEGGDLVVTLSLQAEGLSGRVRRRDAPPDDATAGQAWLLRKEPLPEEPTPHSPVDARGRFYFPRPAAGSYALLLQIGDQDLAVEPLRVE